MLKDKFYNKILVIIGSFYLIFFLIYMVFPTEDPMSLNLRIFMILLYFTTYFLSNKIKWVNNRLEKITHSIISISILQLLYYSYIFDFRLKVSGLVFIVIVIMNLMFKVDKFSFLINAFIGILIGISLWLKNKELMFSIFYFSSYVSISILSLYIKNHLNKIKEKLENLTNQAPGTIYQYQLFPDGSSCFPYASEGICEVYEVKPNEVVKDASKVFERIHPQDYEHVVNTIQYSADNLENWYDEYRVILPRKGEIWLQGNAKPEKLKDGSVLWHGNIREITREKKLHLKIEEQKKRLENIIEGTNAGTWERNLQTGEATIDKKWAEILGYELEELTPMDKEKWQNLIYDNDLEKNKKEIQRLINKEIDCYNFEYRMKHKSGKLIWVNGRGNITKLSKDNKPLLISGTTMDISEKKKYEQEIIGVNERLENIIEATNAGTWEMNVKKNKTSINRKYAEILGYSIEEISPMNLKSWQKLVHHNDFNIIEKEIQKLVNKEIDYYDVEVRMKHKSGKWLWINSKSKVTKWTKDEEALLISGILSDITDKKEAEIKLRESEIRFNVAIEGTEAGIWDWDMVSNEVTFSSQWKKMLGYSDDEIGNSFEDWKKLWHPDDIEGIENAVKDHLDGLTEKYEIVHRLRHKNGKWRWIMTRGKILKDKENKPYRWIGTNIDITRQKDAEEEIYKQKEQFKTTLLSVGDAVISTDKQGKIKLMNKVAEDLTGWTQEEAYNQPLEKVLKIINEYTRETAENPAEKALRLGKIVEMANHTILISKNGKEIPIEDSAAPIKDIDENVTGAVIVFRDFSEKKERQKEIEYLSFHDHLTGLYNRRYMEDSIKRLDTDRNIPFSIIAADINGLKLTNDTYGHEMGDKLLINTSEILKKSCRKEDIICRAGGDEFIILLPNTDGKTTKEIIKRIKEESKNTMLDSVIVSIALGYSTKHKEDEDIFKIHKEADNNMYKNKLKIGKIMRSKTIETLLVNINNKYDNEQIHTERVSQYCEGIAKAMNLNEKDVQDAKIAGVLHDIGKIVVDPELLNKKDKLTDKEWEEIKKHPTSSYQILKNVDEYAHLAEDVLYHHERLDGKGYPEGLKEDEIPLLSKIISVADAYEAMTADRPYKTKKTKEQAIEEMKNYSGTQFDKKIVDVFVSEVL